MNQLLDSIEESEANDTVTQIARILLEPTFNEPTGKTLFKHFEIQGVGVNALYERDPRTKHLKASNFDVQTSGGIIRCGSSARMVAGIVVGFNCGKLGYL